MTEPDQSEKKDLAELLLEHKLLHKAQLELAMADQEINDIPLEEILLFRGWITQEKLDEIAPWLKGGNSGAKKSGNTGQLAKPQAKPADTAAGGAKTGSSQNSQNTATATQNRAVEEKNSAPPATGGNSVASAQVKESPLSSDSEQNLKNYKELLKKILSDK